MLIEKRTEDNKLIACLIEKRLDAAAAVDFKNELMAEVESGVNHMVIDLEKVEFIDSSGLGALVAILKAVSQEGGLTITGLSKKTEQIFKLTRMDTVI